MLLRLAKNRPESREDRTFPRRNKPKSLTAPPLNGFKGSFVPFIIMTEEVPGPAGLHLKFSGVGTSRAPPTHCRQSDSDHTASALVGAIAFRMIRLFVASA